MKATCMVVEDKVEDYEFEGRKGTTRSLQLIDRDTETPLIPKFRLKIPLDDKVAGPAKQANLANAVVEVAITDVAQNEFNKRLTFSGHVVKVVGAMTFVPAQDKKPNQ